MPGLGPCDENISDKHLIVRAAIDAGVKQSAIAEALHYTNTHITRIKQKTEHLELVTAKRIKNAFKAIDYFGDVKNYTGYVKKDKNGAVVEEVPPDPRIRPSDVLAANKEVLARSHPITADIPNGVSQSFCQMHIDKIEINLSPAKPQPVDDVDDAIVLSPEPVLE